MLRTLRPKGSRRNQAPIFILGAMRSGTTLMRLVLDRHPHISVGPESGFMRSVRAIRTVPDWHYGQDWYRRYELSPAELNQRIRRFYSEIFERYAARRGKRRWGEKTPFHRREMQDLAEIFPDALFVVVLRHAGAVAASLERWKYETLDALVDWTTSYRRMLRVSRRLGPSRVQWCRYEDLVSRPEEVTREVMEFLDEPWSERLLQPDEVAEGEDAAVEGGTRRDRAIDTDRLDAWRREISAGLELVEQIAGPTLRELGYEVETAVPSGELRI